MLKISNYIMKAHLEIIGISIFNAVFELFVLYEIMIRRKQYVVRES